MVLRRREAIWPPVRARRSPMIPSRLHMHRLLTGRIAFSSLRISMCRLPIGWPRTCSGISIVRSTARVGGRRCRHCCTNLRRMMTHRRNATLRGATRTVHDARQSRTKRNASRFFTMIVLLRRANRCVTRSAMHARTTEYIRRYDKSRLDAACRIGIATCPEACRLHISRHMLLPDRTRPGPAEHRSCDQFAPGHTGRTAGRRNGGQSEHESSRKPTPRRIDELEYFCTHRIDGVTDNSPEAMV